MDTLTRMRAFASVVEHEGFSAAARAQGRSKALLSKYVRELEDEIGARLLNRTTRQFSLTEAGHLYYARSQDLLREFDDLQDLMRDTGEGISGKIRLSAPRSFADADIGVSLIDFAIANPDVQLDITLDDRIVDLVEEGFDLAIRISSLEDSSLIAKRLSPFRLAICATPEAIRKFGMPKDPAELADLPCIVDTNSRRRNIWPIRDKDGKSGTIQVNGQIEVNSPLVVRNAILRDLGFAVCPDFTVRDDLKAGRLVEIFPDHMVMSGGIFAVYPHRRYLPQKVRSLVDFLAEWFKKHEAESA